MAGRTKSALSKIKALAKYLYINDGSLSQKVLAEKVGVSPKTLKKWIDAEHWDDMRKSLLTTKPVQLEFLYNQLESLNKEIASRDKKYAEPKESDTLIKLTSAIKNLEVEISIGDIVQVAREFIGFVAQEDYEQSKKITTFFDGFINSKMS